MNFKLEVIGFSMEGCANAQAAGAHRIELCDNPGDGGTTPSYGFIKAARQLLNIELYVMIRPRGGDFIYSPAEIDVMKQDILICKELNCDGVVLGLLDSNGNIDKVNTARLVSLAYPMGVTFHRAFDRVKDPIKALEDIKECGCERILTSGLLATAVEGIEVLKQLIDNAGDCIIMPGSGIRADNIITLAENLGVNEFHTSARTTRHSLQLPSFLSEKMDPVTTDSEEIKNIIGLLNKYYKNHDTR